MIARLPWRLAIIRPAAAVRAEYVALAVILAVAVTLRLARLAGAQMRGDDIALWSIVVGLGEQPRILDRGLISSLGIANGPIQAYLLLPARLIEPLVGMIAPYIVVGVFNTLGVALLWRFARTYHGPDVALLSAALFAVNPWAVIFARRLWGDDLLAPVVVLLVG
ncbi:MAG TPA: hypothetical protein VHL09_14100, partial [Dehalococcoidia bacterium]|nr:hypothetical protein [Dehalococcoidia bacterium]